MLVQGAVGLLGYYFRVAANLHGPAPRLWDNFLFGAPALAPLLFPNLVLLACVGLWVLGGTTGDERTDLSAVAPCVD